MKYFMLRIQNLYNNYLHVHDGVVNIENITLLIKQKYIMIQLQKKKKISNQL